MVMRYKFVPVIFLLSFTLFEVGCIDGDGLNDLSVEKPIGEYAIPLVKASINMEDLVQEFDEYTEFDTDSEGVILFKYSGDILKRTSSDIFNSIESSLNGIPIPIDSNNFPIPFTTPDGMEIYLMEVSEGKIGYFFEVEVDEPCDIKILFPQLFDENMESFVQEYTLSPNGEGKITFLGEINLEGKTLIADQNGQVNLQYELTTASGEELLFDDFFIIINDLKFSYSEGVFYNQEHVGELDTIEIEVFENWKGGEIFFENPNITLTVNNSFGVPTRSVVQVFDIHTVDGQVIPLEGEAIVNGIDFDYPTMDEVGVVKSTTFEFNKDNSNVQDVLGSKPLFVEYLVDAITNPEGNDDVVGFIWEESEYSVNVEVELPIHGKVIDFLVVDTFELDMSVLTEQNIEEAMLRLNYETGLPIGFELQLTMLDDSDLELGDVFQLEPLTIQPVDVDSNGEALTSERFQNDILLDTDQIEKLAISKKLILMVRFNSTMNDELSVKVRPEQFLDLSLGMIIKR
jgi:hypothetical protein